MSKLLIVLPCSSNDAPLCERHLDHMFKMNGKRAVGSCLLVFNPDIHLEMVVRIKIAAELAFVNVRETTAPKLPDHQVNNKFLQLNNMFRHAAKVAQQQCRFPWLWLEPDCVPVKPDWIEQLATAYDNQPAKYLGFIGKAADGGKFMARCGIYFLAASYELDSHCQADIPFAIATSSEVIPRCNHTNLIQYTSIERVEDLQKIEPTAVIVHGDKAGIFAENWKAPAIFTTSKSIADLMEVNQECSRLATAEEIAIADKAVANLETPRLSRRQRRELEQNASKV